MSFVDFDPSHYESELGYARWFYRGNALPTMQCVWPNKQGQFPWDPEATESLKAIQPIWGDLPR